MGRRAAVRTLVLEVEGPPRRAARVLADRFPDVACDGRGLALPIGAGRSPEAVLAYCRERGVGVHGSRVRVPRPDGSVAPPDASAPPSREEVVR